MSQAPEPTWLTALLSPAAYPVATEQVERVETHISVVHLLDRDVYKVKKPLDLGFLDFSSLAKRRHYCEEEVRLNRRLAPHVYRGVAPIVPTGDRGGAGAVEIGETGTDPVDAIEFTVHMERLPDAARLADRLAAGLTTEDFWPMLGARLAAFHESAERSSEISKGASFAQVAENARGNILETAQFVAAPDRIPSGAIDPALHARLDAATERALADLRPVIEARAADGIPCDTHGDLRLDHVYHFPDRPAPDDLVIIDCVEFSERFRHADPISDVAFLAMDLQFAGEREAARALIDSSLAASGDEGTLFPWYIAYRSAVRAKIDHLTLAHANLTDEKRRLLEERALGHWLLALAALEPPPERPALVLVGGTPGCGKSTVAEGLSRSAGFEWIRSDGVRQELFAGESETDRYTEANIARVYAECLDRADRVLACGGRALIDATFHRDAPRQDALELARLRRVPGVFIELTIDRETAHARISGRRDDPSDADTRVHDQLAAEWEPMSEESSADHTTIDAAGDRASVLGAALAVLEGRGLC